MWLRRPAGKIPGGAPWPLSLCAGADAASEQQAEMIVQLTDGVEQISGVVQDNSATAEESAASAEELSSQADSLKNLIRSFKLRE